MNREVKIEVVWYCIVELVHGFQELKQLFQELVIVK